MRKYLVSLVLLLGALMLPATVHAQNIYGDVNGDLEVNIADVNVVIDVILGYASNPGANVNGDGEINIADVNAIINIILKDEPVSVEHEWVDLGLPSGTLWATCNIGAENPEDYGSYFAWGETEPKEMYNWSTYKWYNSTYGGLIKYCTEHDYGRIDNKTELEPEDDAAYVNWGPSWRMPTMDQQDELREKCTWQKTEMNGVKGYLVIGLNGNTMFMPVAGARYDDFLVGEDQWGCYWSRTLCSGYSVDAERLEFWYGNVNWTSGYDRDFGLTVRAVRVPQN